MKENDPGYTHNNRRNKKTATRCRVCGGQLLVAQDIQREIHEQCDIDNTNIYLM